MRIAHVRRDDCAAPSLALCVDGCFYDLRALEESWGVDPGGEAFSARVVGLRGAGIEQVESRLLAGDRPTSARLPFKNLVFLPPAPQGASVFVLAQNEAGAMTLDLARDPRWLVGHASAVGLPAHSPFPVEFAAGVLLGEELRGASPIEARHAIIGVGQAIVVGEGAQQGPVALGPVVHLSRQWPELLVRARIGGEMSAGGRDRMATPEPAASGLRSAHIEVAKLSQSRRL